MRQVVRNDEKGLFLVSATTSSQFKLDMNARLVRRQLAATPLVADFLDVDASPLRRNGATLELLMVEHCRVGEPVRLFFQVTEGHITTERMTSPVVRMVELAGSEA
ncbi:hypothetical protein DAD99_20950 [Pseudarthrobacter sp. AB1]|nr:hypothetical protein [Pseudarthrobacter sp. AB1]